MMKKRKVVKRKIVIRNEVILPFICSLIVCYFPMKNKSLHGTNIFVVQGTNISQTFS